MGLYILFVHCSNGEMIDEVLKALNFDKKVISEYIDYKYQNPKMQFDANAVKYDEWNIIGNILKLQTLNRLKRLTEFISEQQLIEGALVSDKNGKNGFEYALCKKQIDVVKFLMSFHEMKKEYVSNKELLWRCIYWMTVEYDESIALYLMNVLNLNEAKLKELQSFQFSKSENDEKSVYSDKKISDEVVTKLLDLKKK